ncbi:hypothetical protein ABPG74_017553 [Tetrahymena malaccensis]
MRNIKQFSLLNRFFSASLSNQTPHYRFVQIAQKPPKSKYSDQYELSSDEIDNVLKKKPKKEKQSVVFATEISQDPTYEKDIKETLQEIQSKPKNYNANQTLAEENDDYLDGQGITSTSSGKGIITGRLDDETRVQVKYYKYDLPIPNIDPEIKGVVDPFERAKREYETSNQRLWALLNLNENTPYETYELALRHKFNNELDMYGDIQDEALIREQQQKELGDGAIPLYNLTNVDYMERMRRHVTVNFNMPGAIELEHPHKFLKELRPIEEFRHTPLIPISEKQMREHQQKVEALSRRGFYYEIKKDTIYNWLLASVAISIGLYMISLVIKKEEEIGIATERLKIERSQIGLAKK